MGPQVAGELVFVQVSDCHFGRVLANNLYASGLRAFAGSGAQQPPHDISLLKAFTQALQHDVRDVTNVPDDVAIPVVMCGDLTASGDASEFAVAHSFFRSRLRLLRHDVSQFEMEAGLALESESLAAVPGNHDNWNGRGFRSSLAFNPALYEAHFRRTPWTRDWFSPDGTVQLGLIGIDSNSGLRRSRNHRAKGAIDAAQLESIGAPLASRPDSLPAVTVKAIVCHHSLAYVAPIGTLGKTELDGPSRDGLLRAAAEHDVAAILTGHTHDPLRHPFDVPVGAVHRRVYELRSASTFQGPPEDGVQGFLLHRIHRAGDGSGYVWSTWRYVYGDGDFIREAEESRWKPIPLR